MSDTPKLSRRAVAGVGTAGALAAAAAALPGLRDAAPAGTDAKPAPDKGGGYRLTPHVLRYYQTTRI